jgi:hypothetical protein
LNGKPFELVSIVSTGEQDALTMKTGCHARAFPASPRALWAGTRLQGQREASAQLLPGLLDKSGKVVESYTDAFLPRPDRSPIFLTIFRRCL